MKLQISLKYSDLLKKRAECEFDLQTALYHAYNKKKGYGMRIFEFPTKDFESFLSGSDDEDISDIGDSISLDYLSISTDNGQQVPTFIIKENNKDSRNGSILELIPQKTEPVFKFFSPIKKVRFLEFVVPFNSEIFEENNKVEVQSLTNIYEYKKVTRTTYDKNEQTFSIDIEEKNFHEEPNNWIDEQKLIYYKKWILSQGNKLGQQYIKVIDFMIQNFKNRISSGIPKKFIIPAHISNQKVYIRQLEKNTLEWIKEQPYFIKKIRLTDQSHLRNVSIVEECYSKKYLEQFGIDTSNLDKTYDYLKKFRQSDITTQDFLASVCNPYNNEGFKTYEDIGLERPYAVFHKNSSLIRNIQEEDIFQGHFVLWSEDYIERSHKNLYVCFYMVFVVENKWKNL